MIAAGAASGAAGDTLALCTWVSRAGVGFGRTVCGGSSAFGVRGVFAGGVELAVVKAVLGSELWDSSGLDAAGWGLEIGVDRTTDGWPVCVVIGAVPPWFSKTSWRSPPRARWMASSNKLETTLTG